MNLGPSTYALLDIDDVRVSVGTSQGQTDLVRGVSLQLHQGESLAIVGESGAGKSMLAFAVSGLLPSTVRVTAGAIRFEGKDLTKISSREFRGLRGSQIAMVYQDPMNSLNPVMRVGAQLAEAMMVHGANRKVAQSRAIELLDRVGIPAPRRVARSFPHLLSGGMQQRAVIALALMNAPRLLIADEPTTALDATVQQQIIELVAGLRNEFRLTVMWVTHDLGVVSKIADRVAVMYAGRIVEYGLTRDIFSRPRHPYTAGLLASNPPVRGRERGRIPQIGGLPPDIANLSPGCPFRPRCPHARAECGVLEPALLAEGAGEVACHFPLAEVDAAC